MYKLPELFDTSEIAQRNISTFKPLTLDDLSHKSPESVIAKSASQNNLLDIDHQIEVSNEKSNVDIDPFLSNAQDDNESYCESVNDDEVLVFKSRASLVKQLNATIRSVDDDGEIYEELARRRLLASRKNSIPEDKNIILTEAKKELIPSHIRKDDRLI